METKICFKCGMKKPLSDYYVHPAMGDGHLGKCKDCTKKDTKIRTDRKLKENPEKWITDERKRGRNKYHRLYVGTGKARPKNNERWMAKYPEKRKASLKSQRIKKPFEGAEHHHWSYNEKHWLDIIWLTKKEHMKGHRFIVYDQERMMYRRTDNHELLDTKEKHESYIRHKIEVEED